MGDVNLSNIIKVFPGHVYWIDQEGNFLGCNDLQAQDLGLKASEDLVGRNLGEFFSEEATKRLIALNHKIIKTGKSVVVEEPTSRYHGELRTYLSQKSPLRDDKGKIIGIVGVSQDITKQKELLENFGEKSKILSQLTQDNHFFEYLINSIPIHIYWLDSKNIMQGCNLLQAKSLGFKSTEEAVGKSMHDLVCKKQASKLIANNNKVMKVGKTLVVEEYVDFVQGAGYYLSYKMPLRDSNKKIIGLLGASIDISEQKNLNRQLLQSKKKAETAVKKLQALETKNRQFMLDLSKRVTGADFKKGDPIIKQVIAVKDFLESIIDAVPGNIFWLDRNNVYLGCNKEHALMAGLKSSHEMIGKTNYDFKWRKHASTLNGINEKVMKNGKTTILEEGGVTAYGERTYLSKKAPLKDGKGKVIGLVGIALDITEKKKMEKDLAAAKEKAEEASKAKTEFILNMEHDIRTPIAHIISFSDILAQSNDLSHDKIKEYLGYINVSGRRLMDLIGEILTFADIEQGNMPLKKGKVNLAEIVTSIIELERPALQHKGLTFKLQGFDEIPDFKSDHSRLHRILLNLISNAIKYTEKGGIVIKADLEKGSKKKDSTKLKIMIEDSGIGIPKEKQEFIFDRFAKLSASNQNKVKGLGLGLWIVKKFVRDLGGEVSVESKVNRGSKFIVMLPFK